MALVLNTNSGFVLTAPVVDPDGTSQVIDGNSAVSKDTAPSGAYRIIEIGWYRSSGTNTANFEVGLYAESAGVAATRLNVDNTNSSSVTGWITVTVDWAITQNTNYWLGFQMDAHSGTSNTDSAASGGMGIDILTSQTTLNDPYGGGAVADADGMGAIYALYRRAILSGTITDDTEANIVSGGSTIILTLDNDTWVTAGATFDGQRQNIINGLDSAQSEATGWDAVVKAGLAVTDVVRTSNTVVTITLPAFASYSITANETITATIPSTALTGAAEAIASPTFTITNVAGGTVLKDVIMQGGVVPRAR